ncbi:preprotein translocase subunit YajC [Luedemannella helvata]|uniref:Preprotein translocase subunit YajC n=1 Tax=Luedemannella helvata TaxID=349315 RepID=A0ABP4WDV4_9ACTN
MIEAANEQAGSGLFQFLPLILIIAAVYFLLIRPQSKRKREQQQMQSSIGPGDEIVTIGGLYGTVTAIDDETVTLEISPGVTARYARGAIARVVTPRPAEETPADEANADAAKVIDEG